MCGTSGCATCVCVSVVLVSVAASVVRIVVLMLVTDAVAFGPVNVADVHGVVVLWAVTAASYGGGGIKEGTLY